MYLVKIDTILYHSFQAASILLLRTVENINQID